jgi:hypothetical protein
MKKLLLAAGLVFSLPAFSQQGDAMKTDDVKKALEVENKDTVAWIRGGILSIGANEGFLHNWAAGGEVASLAVNGVFHGSIVRLHHSHVWSNSLDLTYGLTYNYSNYFIPRKVSDRIDFTSRYGHKLPSSEHMYFSGLFNFRSQFTKGYDYTIDNWAKYPTSKFLSPAYLTLAIGMEYRRGGDLSLFLSPLAGREILSDVYYTSLSRQGAFGIDSGKTSKFQFGAYFSGKYKTNLSKNILFQTRLDLYSNYLAKDQVDASGNIIKKDNPGNIQVYWDNFFVFKTFKSLSFTLGLTMIYDNNFPYSKTYVDKVTGKVVEKDLPGDNLGWMQINQVFTLGLAYKL